MADYIDRAEAIKDFERCNLVNPKWTPERVKQLLCRCPKVDAAPVLHGKWIDVGDFVKLADGTELPVKPCSVCGEYILLEDFQNYCPSCGAKMDLECSEKSNSWKNRKEKMKMSDFKSDFEVICSLGEPALLEQLAEECSELAQAALKLARLERGENPTPKTEEECVENLLEELGDVNLCMSVVEANRGIHIRCLSVDKKARWAKRIREARGETPGKEKTRQSEFLKIFPNVGMEEGVIDVCPKATEKNAICFRLNCKVCKKDYWLAEVERDEQQHKTAAVTTRTSD